MDGRGAMQALPRRKPKPDTKVCLHPDTLQPIDPAPNFFVDGLLAMATEAWDAVTSEAPPLPPPASRFLSSGPASERRRRDAEKQPNGEENRNERAPDHDFPNLQFLANEPRATIY